MTLYFRLLIQAPAQLAWYAAKERPLSILVSLLIVLSFCTNLQSGYYMGKWLPIAAAAGLFAAIPLYEYYGAALTVNFIYCMGSGLWVAGYQNRYSSVNPYDLQAIKLFAVDAIWKLALITFPLLYFAYRPLPIHRLREIGRVFCTLFFCISAVKIGWEWLTVGCAEVNACGGTLMNPSLNASMMAVIIPLTPFPVGFAVIAAGCAFLGKTSIGAGMVALWAAGYSAGRWRKKVGLLLAAVVGLAVLTLGYFTHGGKAFFDSSGRFQMWRFFMGKWGFGLFKFGTWHDWWIHRAHYWIPNTLKWGEFWRAILWHNVIAGTGYGTFGPFSINLQHWFNINVSDWWIWPHNDWMEQFFVGGTIGGILLIWLYVVVTSALLVKGYFAELSSLLLFGVAMGCEYVLHIGPCCAFAAWILTIALFTPHNVD